MILVEVEWTKVKDVGDETGGEAGVEEYRGYNTWWYPRYFYRPYWGGRYWNRYTYGYPLYRRFYHWYPYYGLRRRYFRRY